MANPTFSDFNPKDVAWQNDVLRYMRQEYDYEAHGLLELLLSGAVGSAKSIFAAHMGVTHCLMYSDAVLGLFRQTMPDLKETIFATMEEHIFGAEIIIDGHKDIMREGVHYTINNTKASIDFLNGAKVRSKSWSDKKYKKLRSHNYSAGIWEEVTENDTPICEAVHPEIFSRVGRVAPSNSNVRENWLLYLTNPDSKAHWAYRYFITQDWGEE
ncbi:phage terminase large subunit [Kangiella sp.]|uniref:phage terminase large subunit n=1 Tax=Kangiella sp. TaxID=1920245 RepID=UPI003A924560